jgi:uncharacterized protein
MIAKLKIAVGSAGIVRTVLIALALVALALPVRAEQAQPSEPSPAAMKLAREILDLKNSNAMFEPMVPGVIERVRLMHLQTNPNLRKALDEVAQVLRKAFESRTEDLMQDIAWLYAARFTEAELKEIVAFYKTPTGKKVIELEPRVFDDAMLGLKTWQEKFAEEVLARFRLEMKKRGHSL